MRGLGIQLICDELAAADFKRLLVGRHEGYFADLNQVFANFEFVF